MQRFFSSMAVGVPQYAAACLLGLYLLQCLWLVQIQWRADASPNSGQSLRIYLGLQQWKSGAIAGTPETLHRVVVNGLASERPGHLRVREGFDEDRSPLYYVVAAAPFLVRPASWIAGSFWWRVQAVTPYLFFGVMLGGSLWYVARRLYGNAGGYVALLLYCFSPAMVSAVADPQSLGDMGAAWGGFGAVWTAIAVAHTLYAPREVVLWNWRRISLLGLSLALAIGNQFSLAVLAACALLLMLWLAPVRRGAVLTIWGSSCLVAAVIIFAAYGFGPALFLQGLSHARWLDFDPRALVATVAYRHGLQTIFSGSPALMLFLPAALFIFVLWNRSRYFGNQAPLAIALLLFVLGVAAPGFPGAGFQITSLVFLFLFVGGVFADLWETPQRMIVTAAVSGLLIASAFWNISALARAAK